MTNKEYWINRTKQNTRMIFDKTNEEMKQEIIKVYSDMSDWMEKEINVIYYKLLEDNISRTDIWTYKHYRTLAKELAIKVAEIGNIEERVFNTKLEGAIKEQYKTTPIPNTIKAPTVFIDELKVKTLLSTSWKGGNYSSRIWANKEKMLTLLKEGITRTITLGDSKDKAVAKLRDLILSEKPDKSFSGAFADADCLVRTELQSILVRTQAQRYTDCGMKKGQVITADDERRCEQCENRDGMIFDLATIDETLPMHPRCRCDFICVIDW